jgi:DedD protein
MRLPFLRPKAPAAERSRPAAAGDAAPLIVAARTQARRRLIGALVLLAVGVIGFPVLFETQPRPLPMDTPIEVPVNKPVAAVAALPIPVPPPALQVEAATLAAPVATASAALVPSVAASRPSAATSAAADPGASAPAVLPSALATKGERFVVQIGAYTDAATLRDARQKVEKLGLKTYTQVIETDAGKRTRVRVGPWATREEADAVALKVRRAGLPANIVAL